MDITSLTQIGPYHVRRFIDAGAFAWVFEVIDPKFEDRRLALKMLKPEAAAGEEFQRFESEARLLAQIDHPSVVTIFDFGRDEESGNFFYVMTFVDGPTLKTKLKEGPLSIEEALPIFVDLLDGLAVLHAKGIVHRDIKPANVLIGSDGRARLADLGIARVEAERGRTRTGTAVGTALYMSPEQARGRAVGSRSDLFSLGLTLYETLTGRVVYDYVASVDSSSGMDVLMYLGSLVHTSSEFEVQFDSGSNVPPAVQRIILKSLRLNPEDRYARAAEMRDALRQVLRGPSQTPARSAIRVRDLGAAAAALFVVLALVSSYFFYWVPHRQRIELHTRVERLYAGLESLASRSVSVLSGAEDLSPGPPAPLLEKLRQQVERGDGYREDGKADIAAGSPSSALKNIERGRVQYTQTCQKLVDGFLGERANSEFTAIRERAVKLDDAGAQEVTPEAWHRLTKQLSLAGPSESRASIACESAEAELGRLRVVEAIVPLAQEIEDNLAERWPKIVDAEHEKAVTARLLAVAQPVPDREYKTILKRAKRYLLRGSLALRAGDHRAARDAYHTATADFVTASAIAPAALARSEAQALAGGDGERGVLDPADAAPLLASAEGSWAAGAWRDAEQGFKQASARLKDLRQAQEWRNAAEQAEERAREQRTQAVAAGAEGSAPTEFAPAEAALAEAKAQLESGDSRAAELGFVSARDRYVAAHKRAIEQVRAAEMKRVAVMEQASALVPGGHCGVLPSEQARTHCETAQRALAEGSKALEGLDATSARRQFLIASESCARLQSAQLLWESTRPRPPELVRRMPRRTTVPVSPRQLRSFAIEASDPNGDLLHYSWSIDGIRQTEHGPSIERRLEQNATIRVKVDDGAGGELLESWNVEVLEPQASQSPN